MRFPFYYFGATALLLTSSQCSPLSVALTRSLPGLNQVLKGLEPRAASFDEQVELIYQRRLDNIFGQTNIIAGAEKVSKWLSSLGKDGKWPEDEVDMTTGCAARRANWPAQTHLLRVVTMSAVWHGGLPGGASDLVKNQPLREGISRAMDYWFKRDFVGDDCMDSGGTDKCPCSNPDNTLWNTNWFSNTILTPRLIIQTCLVLRGTLSDAQLAKCKEISGRAFRTLGRPVNGVSSGMTGANAVDVARIGMDSAVLSKDETMLQNAIQLIQKEMVIQNGVQADGVRADGSFAQHTGLMYNGNYGKDFANGVIDLETEIAGTQFAATGEMRSVLETYLEGSKWMIYRNALLGVLHWDLNAYVRFLVYPTSDFQPPHDTSFNFTKIADLGKTWNSEVLSTFAASLLQGSDYANSGGLSGNRMFFANDYMVQRGETFVSTLKMWSSRTKNTECTNSANPKGFQLSSGAVYNYVLGEEYEDVPAYWDWSLIPGTTVDYGNTPLTCDNTRKNGMEAFVGGVSNGKIGVAAMVFTNPTTRALSWKKAWFNLGNGVQIATVAGLISTSSAPVYTVLDQRLHTGKTYIDKTPMVEESMTSQNARTIWHAGVGYVLPPDSSLTVKQGKREGNWQDIGTSEEPKFTGNIFVAYIEHKDLSKPIAYATVVGISTDDFAAKAASLVDLRFVRNDENVAAFHHADENMLMVVFWDRAGGKVEVDGVTLGADKNTAIMLNLKSGEVSVSDPSQQEEQVMVSVSTPAGQESLVIKLPRGGVAGQTVSDKFTKMA